MGWRNTLVLFALINIVICLPLHWLGLRRRCWVASMKGVAQFGGRVVEIAFGRNLRAITVGREGTLFSVLLAHEEKRQVRREEQQARGEPLGGGLPNQGGETVPAREVPQDRHTLRDQLRVAYDLTRSQKRSKARDKWMAPQRP